MVKTALIVVDAQRIYTDRDSEMFCRDSKRTIDRINDLIGLFQSKRLPIFLVRHVHKVDGTDLGRMFDFTGEPEEDFNFKEDSPEVTYDARLKRPSRSIELTKNRYSAFTGTDLEKLLKRERVGRVVICGFMTNFCCESTARDAHDRDYFVDFVIDATGTPGTDKLDQQEIRKVVSELLSAGFAVVVTTKQALKRPY
jgi:ureidoacrylate peracid hydrolase